MKLSQISCAMIATVALAACSEAPDPAGDSSADTSMAEPAGGQTVNLIDYGYLDGGELSPITMPEWVPASITFPDDFVAVEGRAMGTKTFLLRGITKQPSDGLFDSLSQNLNEAGFKVREGDNYRDENLVYFSGNGYENSTIRIRPGETDTLLEVGLVKAD